jgi:DNA-binding PadR family transcriptional regulator
MNWWVLLKSLFGNSLEQRKEQAEERKRCVLVVLMKFFREQRHEPQSFKVIHQRLGNIGWGMSEEELSLAIEALLEEGFVKSSPLASGEVSAKDASYALSDKGLEKVSS